MQPVQLLGACRVKWRRMIHMDSKFEFQIQMNSFGFVSNAQAIRSFLCLIIDYSSSSIVDCSSILVHCNWWRHRKKESPNYKIDKIGLIRTLA